MNPLIAFDLDGSLIDSVDDIADAVNDCRRAHDLEALPRDIVKSHMGNGVRKLMEGCVPELLPHFTLQQLADEEGVYYAKRIVDKTRLYPGGRETLERLVEMGYRLAAVTNKQTDLSEIILERLGVRGLFSSVVGGGRIPQFKPEPEPVLLALEESGAVAEGGWFVGDNWTDMGVARATGLRACFCAYGYGSMRETRADAVIWSLPQLLTVIS